MSSRLPAGLILQRGRIVCRLDGGAPAQVLGTALALAGGSILGAAIAGAMNGGRFAFGPAGTMAVRLLGGVLGGGLLLLGGFLLFHRRTLTIDLDRGELVCREGWLFLGSRQAYPLRNFTRLVVAREEPMAPARGTPIVTHALRLEGPGMAPLALVQHRTDRAALARAAAEVSRLSGVPLA